MEDRRKARSSRYITEALIKLMEEKDLQAISIQEIVDKAQVARSTFYSLYEDKQHFINQLIGDIFAGLRAETKPEKFSESSGFDKNTRHRFYVKHFNYISQNADLFRVMFSDHGTLMFRRTMEESASITYEEILRDIGASRLPIPKDYLIQYVISAHMGLTIKWLQEGMKYSPEYMAELISKLTFEGIFKSLGLDQAVTLPK